MEINYLYKSNTFSFFPILADHVGYYAWTEIDVNREKILTFQDCRMVLNAMNRKNLILSSHDCKLVLDVRTRRDPCLPRLQTGIGCFDGKRPLPDKIAELNAMATKDPYLPRLQMCVKFYYQRRSLPARTADMCCMLWPEEILTSQYCRHVLDDITRGGISLPAKTADMCCMLWPEEILSCQDCRCVLYAMIRGDP